MSVSNGGKAVVGFGTDASGSSCLVGGSWFDTGMPQVNITLECMGAGGCQILYDLRTSCAAGGGCERE